MTSREREQIKALKGCTVDVPKVAAEMSPRDRDFIRHMAHMASHDGLLSMSEGQSRYLRALMATYFDELCAAGKRDLAFTEAPKAGVKYKQPK